DGNEVVHLGRKSPQAQRTGQPFTNARQRQAVGRFEIPAARQLLVEVQVGIENTHDGVGCRVARDEGTVNGLTGGAATDDVLSAELRDGTREVDMEMVDGETQVTAEHVLLRLQDESRRPGVADLRYEIRITSGEAPHVDVRV